MFKLTAATRDEQIERATRDELRDALLNVVGADKGAINKMKKGERVEHVKLVRDDWKRQAVSREAFLETQRLAKVETEKMNPVYTAAVAAIHRGVEKRLDTLTVTVTEWQEKVTGSDPFSVVWNMENGLDDVFFATKYADYIRPMVRYLAKQSDDRTDTVQDIKKYMVETSDELTRRCLNDEDYNHNSTSEVDSVKSRAGFRALQHAARLLRSVVDAFGKDCAADEAAHRLAHSGTYVSDNRYYG